jgi:hypothetical protein
VIAREEDRLTVTNSITFSIFFISFDIRENRNQSDIAGGKAGTPRISPDSGPATLWPEIRNLVVLIHPLLFVPIDVVSILL